jgi:hypothetical protein
LGVIRQKNLKREEFSFEKGIGVTFDNFSPSKQIVAKLFLHALPNWEMGKMP